MNYIQMPRTGIAVQKMCQTCLQRPWQRVCLLPFLAVFRGEIAGLSYSCTWQSTGFTWFSEDINFHVEATQLDRMPVQCPRNTAMRQIHLEEMQNPASLPYFGQGWFFRYNYECCHLPVEAVEQVCSRQVKIIIKIIISYTRVYMQESLFSFFSILLSGGSFGQLQGDVQPLHLLQPLV
jgi:hypothetical protein